MLQNKKLQFGFTLIELLVVIAIIGVLSTMAIIALGNARAKARDSKRVADIKQISTALELYYSDYNTYPTIITPGNSLTSPDGTKVYMSTIPNNPTPRNDGNCGNVDYSYQSSLTGTNYSLGSCLGSGSGNMSAGAFFTSNNSGPLAQATVIDIDGNTYNTVQIGTQCWMKENLRNKSKPDRTCINSGSQPCSDASVADNGLGRACYNNIESNCLVYGALYRWTAAMDNSIIVGAQGICPNGWHIPTNSEWTILENYLWDGTGACSYPRITWECNSAGIKLKPGGSSNFQGILSGTRGNDGITFLAPGTSYGVYTVSERPYGGTAYYFYLNAAQTTTWRYQDGATNNVSVRCIKN
ncbi:MAG: prepilin-type N-terminal cleavage/methylation domain-containing protein [Candidatus Falkowbacteria bacterium]|nr:prepilin-type N-terminal cleavage/methylation domain-containing protein [Candidatus Falkowbacteria bacterium]